jgi:hypothetical protein
MHSWIPAVYSRIIKTNKVIFSIQRSNKKEFAQKPIHHKLLVWALQQQIEWPGCVKVKSLEDFKMRYITYFIYKLPRHIIK